MSGSTRSSRGRPLFLAALAAGAVLGASGQLRADDVSEGTRVVRIDVDGHRSVSTREVVAVILPDRREPFDECVVAARVDTLLGRLARRGRPFADVEVSWRDVDGGVALSVNIDEGRDATLSAITVSGAESMDAEAALERAGVTQGSPLTAGALQPALDELLSLYAEAGRPFAEVRVAGISAAPDGGLDLCLDVEEGLATHFESMSVVGNEVTRDHVVERESGIVRGAAYSARRLERVRTRLERLGFFERVSDPRVTVDPRTGGAAVGVEVVERPTSRISGVFGYVPSFDGAEGEFTGLVDVELRNIAGTGRSAAAAWERLARDRATIEFSYTEPWLLGAPIDVGVRGAQTVNDTIYTTTEGDLLLTARAGDRTRVTWSVGAEKYVPGAADDATTTSYRTGVSAEYDGADVPGNPTRGLMLRGALEYAAKRRDAGDESDRSGTATVEAETFLPVTRNQVVAARARLSGVASTEDDVPYHEQLVLGGARDLRGYREEQFRGTRTALATVEYRLLLARRSRALAFVDVGYYFRGGSNSAKDTKLGYGIGLRAQTRLGIISLDYGLGEGDRLLDGKLHVGLVREF